jgi:hypothetical protein
MYLVQPVPNKWNVVIGEVRHEQQIFSTSTSQRLDAHIKDVGTWRRNRGNKVK